MEAFRYCPHDLDAACDCRKPKPGMLLSAARDFGLDLGRSWMIGDTAEDVEAGRAAGCRTIRLTTAPGGNELSTPTLLEAAGLVLSEQARHAAPDRGQDSAAQGSQ